MNLVVLIAGIADPKLPLSMAPDRQSLEGERIASPFDEAAIETALRIRDAVPSTALTVVVAGETGSQGLIRKFAAFRPDRIVRLDMEVPCWSARQTARHLAAAIVGVAFDVVLLGREFGDADDGAVPPALAEELGRPYFGLCQGVRTTDGVVLFREIDRFEESIAVDSPIVVSVTNDRGNRLRHPLMKNMMMARTAPFDAVASPVDRLPGVRSMSVTPVEPQRRAAARRILAGPMETQIAELAAFLRAGEPKT
jgi:electron transfer flavoprotein beta subunit